MIGTMTPASRTAISLNNLGVRFSERRYGKEAFETFRDAVTMVQVACDQQSGNSIGADGKNCDKLIRKAAQRLAQTSLTANLPTGAIVFSSLSDTSDFLAVDEESSNAGDNRSSFYGDMIRIEDYGMSDHNLSLDCDLNAAIILHNFGLSSLSLSLSTRDEAKSAKFRKSAVKLVIWSHALAVPCIFQPDRFASGEPDERAYLITLVVAKSIYQTLQLIRHGNASDDVGTLDLTLQRFEQVKQAVFARGSFYGGFRHYGVFAASAA